MYQLATKIYDNEIATIETKIDDNVYLITNLYKFIHNDKKKEWKYLKKCIYKHDRYWKNKQRNSRIKRI